VDPAPRTPNPLSARSCRAGDGKQTPGVNKRSPSFFDPRYEIAMLLYKDAVHELQRRGNAELKSVAESAGWQGQALAAKVPVAKVPADVARALIEHEYANIDVIHVRELLQKGGRGSSRCQKMYEFIRDGVQDGRIKELRAERGVNVATLLHDRCGIPLTVEPSKIPPPPAAPPAPPAARHREQHRWRHCCHRRSSMVTR